MKTADYEVKGMHCISCSMGISKLLKRQKGVDNVDMQLPQRMFTITYDDAQIDHKTIVETVAKLGYKAELRD